MSTALSSTFGCLKCQRRGKSSRNSSPTRSTYNSTEQSRSSRRCPRSKLHSACSSPPLTLGKRGIAAMRTRTRQGNRDSRTVAASGGAGELGSLFFIQCLVWSDAIRLGIPHKMPLCRLPVRCAGCPRAITHNNNKNKAHSPKQLIYIPP